MELDCIIVNYEISGLDVSIVNEDYQIVDFFLDNFGYMVDFFWGCKLL